ncbi:hypothetical protein LINPERPRIM_LOCUS25497, partial [Linum perenne]
FHLFSFCFPPVKNSVAYKFIYKSVLLDSTRRECSSRRPSSCSSCSPLIPISPRSMKPPTPKTP